MMCGKALSFRFSNKNKYFNAEYFQISNSEKIPEVAFF